MSCSPEAYSFFPYALRDTARSTLRFEDCRWVVVDLASQVKGTKMNKANEARRKAEAEALAVILRERSRSNASGVHANKGERRARTRSARKAVALREW